MQVFVTAPKLFDGRKLRGKEVDIIYIFDSPELYRKLAQKYKCVHLSRWGRITAENFFPDPDLTEKEIDSIMSKRWTWLENFRLLIKREQRRNNLYFHGEGITSPLLGQWRKNRRLSPAEKMAKSEEVMKKALFYIYKLRYGERYIEKYGKYVEMIYNYAHSFFRAYTYAQGFPRGYEVWLDDMRFIYIGRVMALYHFDRRDLRRNGFAVGYLRVLSRLFIEDTCRYVMRFWREAMEEWLKMSGREPSSVLKKKIKLKKVK